MDPLAERDQVIQALKRLKPELLKRAPITFFGLFGSYLRGEQTSSSDIDVLIDVARPINLFDWIELEQFLSDALNKPVDLVIKTGLKPTIGKHILAEVQEL